MESVKKLGMAAQCPGLAAFPFRYTLNLCGNWLAGKERMEKKMEAALIGYLGTTITLRVQVPLNHILSQNLYQT